jgi:hypothetical protein
MALTTYQIPSSAYISGTLSSSSGVSGSFSGSGAQITGLPITGISGGYTSGSLLVSNGTVWTTMLTSSIASGLLGGTANYIPLWNSSNTLTSSLLYQTAGNKVGVGTTTPTDEFTVNGTTNSSQFRTGQMFVSGNFISGSVKQISKGGDGSSYLLVQAQTETSNRKARLILSSSDTVGNSGSVEFNTNAVMYPMTSSFSLTASTALTVNKPVIAINSTNAGSVHTLPTSGIEIGTRVTIVNYGNNAFAINPGGSAANAPIASSRAKDFIYLSLGDFAWFTIE